jgi:hypothetical protein
MVNLSFEDSSMPAQLKMALLSPLLKKLTLDSDILKNFRPVSNLTYVSKLIERIVAVRFTEHMQKNNLHEKYQSAYTKHTSTETAVTKVYDAILKALDDKQCAVLVLLDLSAAFDTVDHSILLKRLEKRTGITGDALQWFKSYLSDRTQAVNINGVKSTSHILTYGVPQGSVMGPYMYVAYVLPLGDILRKHGMSFHIYADDTQMYVSFDLKKDGDLERNIKKLEECIAEIRVWMRQNFLKGNDEKTEVLFLGSATNISRLSQPAINIGDHDVESTKSVRNLGAIFDETMSMENHVNNVCRAAHMHLRNIGRIRRYLTQEAAEVLVHSFVSTKLDYMNALLVGLPGKLLKKLQKVQNLAARIVTKTKRTDHITPILKKLHWLPVCQRIEYKILMLTYKALNGLAPDYIKDMLVPYVPTRTLRSEGQMLLVEPSTKTSYGDRRFSKMAPKLWNRLSLKIRQSSTIDIFKSNLKTYLFRNAYN